MAGSSQFERMAGGAYCANAAEALGWVMVRSVFIRTLCQVWLAMMIGGAFVAFVTVAGMVAVIAIMTEGRTLAGGRRLQRTLPAE